jgi:hypothetical protein
MATATERGLDVQVDKALATLRRRRALKEVSVIVVLIAVIGGLLALTAIMYQEPIDAQKYSEQPGQQPPAQQ